MGKKIMGKGEKWWSPAFSPFPTIFSEGFFLRVINTVDYAVKATDGQLSCTCPKYIPLLFDKIIKLIG